MTPSIVKTTAVPKTVEDLREFCDRVHNQRKEDVKILLTKWLKSSFISRNRPWRAVIGNKKCSPIPIYKDFEVDKTKYLYADRHFSDFVWPDLPDKDIREIIESLGFVITENHISISVPAQEKGKPLTFAQEWVQKINDAYALYVRTERKKARVCYFQLISALCDTPAEKIQTRDEYTLFENFTFNPSLSHIGSKYLKELLSENGLEEFFEGTEYKGIRILRQPSN